MGLRIVIVGVPGVGKSTVVEKAKGAVPGSSVQVFGTAMFDEALRLKWVKHRDEMRKLPVEKQKKLQEAAAAAHQQGEGEGGLHRHAPLHPDARGILARAPAPRHPADEADAPHPRGGLGEGDTRAPQERHHEVQGRGHRGGGQRGARARARSFLSTASLVSGAPMMFIHNEEGKSEKAAKQIAALVRGAKV